MNKRNIKNILLILMIIIYLIVYRTQIYINLSNYKESITSSFMILFSFLSINLLGFQKNGNSKLKKTIINGNIIIILLFYILLLIIGLCNSFITNTIKSYDSIIYVVVTILSIEIFRYVIIKANIDKKYIIYISTIVIILFEYICCDNTSMIKIISENILISYLVYNIGIIPGIIYRVLMNIIVRIIPVTPNISDFVSTSLYVFTTFICYIYSSHKIKKYDIERNNKSKVLNISLVSFCIVLICLVSHLFPFCIIGIGTGSMEPELHVGDAVVVQKLSKDDKISEGQIIVFNVENIQVIHRVVEVRNNNNKNYYKTKGDANNADDNAIITKNDIYGVVKFKIPFIAKPTIYLNKFLNGD